MDLKFLIVGFMAGISMLSIAAKDTFTFENPDVKVFIPDKEKADGRAVIICPGGGYAALATGREGYDWAPFFNDRGIAVAVLKYRMPNGDPSIPVSDVQTTFRILKENADAWNIYPENIGLMGSSAGGHLAMIVATDTEDIDRPAFQILFYPVITMDKKLTHIGSHDNLLGYNASPELEMKYSGEHRVTAETPRTYMALSSDDDVVSPRNAIHYYEALISAGIQTELHIYPTGGHGWGYKKEFIHNSQMLADLSAWLENF